VRSDVVDLEDCPDVDVGGGRRRGGGLSRIGQR
jgi:hypothetical protein